MKVWKTKLHWVKSLRVGDPVVDCKGEVSPIKRIERITCLPHWLVVLTDRVSPSDDIWYHLDTFVEKHWPKKWRTWVDSDLLLENGVWCSGINCATPAEEQ